MRAPICCLLFLLPLALAASTVHAAGVQPRIRMGDDPRWAQPGWDDGDWATLGREGVPTRTGILWLRFNVTIPEAGTPPVHQPYVTWGAGPIDSVFLTPAFSFELYWDGHLLDRNGQVGHSAAEERPGTLNRLVRIPPELLAPGVHLIALRVSSYHYNFPATHSRFMFTMENFERRLIQDARRPVLPLIGVGGALLVAVVCTVFYFLAERRRPILIGALLGVAMAVFYGLISLRWVLNHTYDWHCPRLTAITATMAVIGVLLPWMLIEQFAVPRKWLVFGLLLPALAAAWFSSPIYEVKTLWLCRTMLAVSLLPLAWATWRRRPGAWFVLLGILAGLLLVRTEKRAFLDPTFFLLVEVLVLVPLVSLGLQLQSDRRRAREARLSAARLETELLKKNIQPHFLINTLATLMEIIERDPRAAVALIESLAAEFRILASVSGEKLIPLGQELDLCRAHLRTMSLRKDAQCTLETHGVDERTLVPPALFHTLVENGLTHLRPRHGQQRFTLRQEWHGPQMNFTFTAEGEPTRTRRTLPNTGTQEGTGLRYIKARLEESFAARWKLDGTPIDGGWRTVIEIAPAPAAETPPEIAPAIGAVQPRQQPA